MEIYGVDEEVRMEDGGWTGVTKGHGASHKYTRHSRKIRTTYEKNLDVQKRVG